MTWGSSKEIVKQQSTNSLDVADVDFDGDMDVVTGEHKGDKELKIWTNNGKGIFTGNVISTGKENHNGGQLVDLDGDGDLDIVSITWNDNYLTTGGLMHMWRNDNFFGSSPIIGINPLNNIANPGFESGITSWSKSTGVTFSTVTPGFEGTKAAKLVIGTTTTNMQFYQANIPLGTGLYLEPNTRYRLSFTAYSTTGHDIRVKLIKHVSPYTNYGVDKTFNLNTDWQTFSTEFTTSGFTTRVKNGRLQFFLTGTGLGAKGDIYYLDNVKLEKI